MRDRAKVPENFFPTPRFALTFCAAYTQPFREQTTFFALGAVRNVWVILALEHCSVTTVRFPLARGRG